VREKHIEGDTTRLETARLKLWQQNTQVTVTRLSKNGTGVQSFNMEICRNFSRQPSNEVGCSTYDGHLLTSLFTPWSRV